MNTELTTDQMLADLSITFPALWKRPLSEIGKDYAGKPGVWTGADSGHLMPDGEPMFCTLADGSEAPYLNPPIHEAFEAWLSNRGWCWENYDGETMFLIPNSSYAWRDAWLAEHQAAFRQSVNAATDSDPCPF